jgi:hypothetical protein
MGVKKMNEWIKLTKSGGSTFYIKKSTIYSVNEDARWCRVRYGYGENVEVIDKLEDIMKELLIE